LLAIAADDSRFADVAAHEGFASVHAIPMRLHEQVLGALNLFGEKPGHLDADDRTLAQALAHVATIALVRQNQDLTEASVLPGLQAAVASRAALEMAKGVLAEVLSIDPEQAFGRLRAYARERGQHLAVVANTVVHGAPSARITLFAELSAAPPA